MKGNIDCNGVISRLRHLMDVKGYSQRRLAEVLRLDPSNLSKALSGKMPSPRGS